MVLENIQISLEPFGGGQHGIVVVRNGNNKDHLKVLGEEEDGIKAIVSTGDRIRVTILGNSPSSIEYMRTGVTVEWTISDIRTTGVIAKGEFVVPEP